MKSYLVFLAACFCAAPVFAQTGAQMGITGMLKQPYTTVKNNLTNAANLMPEADYSFKPTPEQMSFGQWVAHVADTQTRQCSGLNGQPKTGDAASKTSKTDLVAALKASFAECDAAFDKLTDANALELVGAAGGGQQVVRAGMLAYVNTHDSECYGNMAVYLRLKNIVPPSTADRAAASKQERGRGR